MKAKEKAIELVNNFKEYADEEYHECSLQYDLNKARENNAKQCAIIAVDELIKFLPVSSRILTDFTELDKQFWIEVKKEIELL